MVRLLIDYGAKFGGRELRKAISKGRKEIVEILLSQGIETTERDIYLAADKGRQDIAEVLSKHFGEINPYIAAILGDIAAVRAELDRGMDANATELLW